MDGVRIVKGSCIYFQKWRVGVLTACVQTLRSSRFFFQVIPCRLFMYINWIILWLILISFCFFRFLKDGRMVLCCGRLPLVVGIKSSQTSMLSSKIKLIILYIINTFRRVLVTPKTNTNISRYFVWGNRLFIFLKIGLRSIFGKRGAWWNIHIFPKEIQNASEIVSLNITEFLSRVKLPEEHDRKAKFKPRLCAR